MSPHWHCSHIRKRRPFERRNPPKVAIGEGCPTTQPKVGRYICNFLVVYDGHKFDILTIRTSFKLLFHVSLFVLMVQDEAHTCSMIPSLITPGEYTSSARTNVPLVRVRLLSHLVSHLLLSLVCFFFLQTERSPTVHRRCLPRILFDTQHLFWRGLPNPVECNLEAIHKIIQVIYVFNHSGCWYDRKRSRSL